MFRRAFVATTLLLLPGAGVACSTPTAQTASTRKEAVVAPANPEEHANSNSEAARDRATVDSPIRRVDFFNFTYPWPHSVYRWSRPRSRRFTLRDGELPERPNASIDAPPGDNGVSLRSLEYADVTGDGVEEALIVVNAAVC